MCKTASKFEKLSNLKNWPSCSSHSFLQNVAISCCCFVTFCKKRQRIITHAHTAISLVAVAAESAENISAMKRNQNIQNGVPTISPRVVSRKSICCRASNILGRTGYHV